MTKLYDSALVHMPNGSKITINELIDSYMSCDCIDKYSAASLREEYEAKLKTMQASRDTFREAAARNGRLLARLRVALGAYPDSDLVSLAEYYLAFYREHAEADPE